MAIINCGECSASVSTEAKTCPGCGAARTTFRKSDKSRQKMSWPKKLAIAFGGVFVVGVVGQLAAGSTEANQGAPTETARDKQTKERDYMAYLAAKAVKSSLRNPDSLAFVSIRADEDGGVICMIYRAENGFGGMNVEHVLFKDGEPTESVRKWNANCAHRKLYDVTAVKGLIS